MARFINRHHKLPRSRQGSDDDRNIVFLDSHFHAAFHTVYENLTLEEGELFLNIVMNSDPFCVWTHPLLRRLRDAIKKPNNAVAIHKILKEAENGKHDSS